MVIDLDEDQSLGHVQSSGGDGTSRLEIIVCCIGVVGMAPAARSDGRGSESR